MHGTFTKTDPVTQLLRDGADLLEKRGHTKGILVDDKGRLCFMGALVHARNSQYPTELDDAIRRVSVYLGLRYADINSVVAWNNDPDRTAQEVIDVMRNA